MGMDFLGEAASARGLAVFLSWPPIFLVVLQENEKDNRVATPGIWWFYTDTKSQTEMQFVGAPLIEETPEYAEGNNRKLSKYGFFCWCLVGNDRIRVLAFGDSQIKELTRDWSSRGHSLPIRQQENPTTSSFWSLWGQTSAPSELVALRDFVTFDWCIWNGTPVPPLKRIVLARGFLLKRPLVRILNYYNEHRP